MPPTRTNGSRPICSSPGTLSPPYQTVIYFPGGILSAMVRSSNDIEHYRDFEDNFGFLSRAGEQ